MKLILGEPKIVGQASPSVRGWGPYQFPRFIKDDDGAIYAKFHVGADAASDYGKPNSVARYDAAADAWIAIESEPETGTLMPNGARMRPINIASTPLEKADLPAKPVCYMHFYGHENNPFYFTRDIPWDLRGGLYKYRRPKEREWSIRRADAGITEQIQLTTAGILPRAWYDRLFVTHDKTRAIMYGYTFFHTPERRDIPATTRPMYLESTDCGESWRFLSTIPYTPDFEHDPTADKRDGFTEPYTIELRDGALFSLLRSEASLYACRSLDGGKSWEKPYIFDDRGVDPSLLALDCGVTLASYGRPGFFLRATDDENCQKWDERITLVEPNAKAGAETCSYSDLIALGEREAMVIYSNFNYPNADGVPVKTILTQKIRVEE